jgi:hypothetical protein
LQKDELMKLKFVHGYSILWPFRLSLRMSSNSFGLNQPTLVLIFEHCPEGERAQGKTGLRRYYITVYWSARNKARSAELNRLTLVGALGGSC